MLQMVSFHFFVCVCGWSSSIMVLHYIYITFLIHSSVDRHFRCFHVLAIVNSAAMNIGVHVSFWIVSFSGYMQRSGFSGSYGNSLVWFLKETPYYFPLGYNDLHSQQQCRRVPIYHPFPAFFMCSLFNHGILASVRFIL